MQILCDTELNGFREESQPFLIGFVSEDSQECYGELEPTGPAMEAITRLWGFASENARHIREGREPTYAKIELAVSVAAV